MRLPRPLRRDASGDMRRWPHIYRGPSGRGSVKCRIERKWAGGVIIMLPDGMRLTVPRSHVERR